MKKTALIYKEPECPKCHSKDIAEIIYGEVYLNEELDEALENKEVILGGCCVNNDSPIYHCNGCGEEFGRYDELRDK